MNWFQRVINTVQTRALSVWSNQVSWGGLVSAGNMASSGVLVSPERALSMTAYYAAVNRISTDVASLPIKLCRRKKGGGRSVVTDDPRADLLSVSPDGETTSIRWRQAWLGHVLGWGNGYAEIEFDKGGRVLGLYLLDPATTGPERKPQDGRLFYRLSKPGSATTTINPMRVLHVAGLGFDGLKGYSVAKYHSEAVGMALAAERSGGAFFGNGSRLSGVIELPYRLKDQAAVDQLKRGWHAEYGGPDNAGKTAVLEGGGKFSPLSIPPGDAQYIQTREFQVIEIARMFGIPPHKIGDYSATGSVYRQLEDTNLDYLTTTIRPWCEQIEQELNRKLLTQDERRKGLYFIHDMTEFLRGDAKTRVKYYEGMLGLSVLCPNDIAALEGHDPLGKEGDKRYLSVQFTPLEVALAGAKPPGTPGAPAPVPGAPTPDDTTESPAGGDGTLGQEFTPI